MCYYGAFFQLDVLEEVVRAVEGRCEVYIDGGVRRGTDVLKALALGAKAVFIGRPVLWGLACQVMQYTIAYILIIHNHKWGLRLPTPVTLMPYQFRHIKILYLTFPKQCYFFFCICALYSCLILTLTSIVAAFCI